MHSWTKFKSPRAYQFYVQVPQCFNCLTKSSCLTVTDTFQLVSTRSLKLLTFLSDKEYLPAVLITG
jgi:hypothetical protein